MVTVAAVIASKSGQIEVSRSFIPLSKSRLDTFISTFFSKLNVNDQCTLVETDLLRFLYHPISEAFFLILLTTQDSSIVMDIQSLNLASSLVTDLCQPDICVETLAEQAFEILFAFDELFPMPLMPEHVSMATILTNLAMESQNEKIEEMITKDKEKEAKQKAKEKMKQLEQQRREAARKASVQKSYVPPATLIIPTESLELEDKIIKPGSKGGMQLSRKKVVISEQAIQVLGDPVPTQPQNSRVDPLFTGLVTTICDPSPILAFLPSVSLTFQEQLILSVHKDGGINHFEIKGDLHFMVNDDSCLYPRMQLDVIRMENVQYKTHPNIDKKQFEHNVLQAKDQQKPFPLNQSLSILKWKFSSTQESDIPLTVTCWPTARSSNMFDVIVEFQLERPMELANVVISIPLPSDQSPSGSCSVGKYNWKKSNRTLVWTIPLVNSEADAGTFEFSIAGSDEESFFPVHISFSSSSQYIPNTITSITSCQSDNPLPFKHSLDWRSALAYSSKSNVAFTPVKYGHPAQPLTS